MKSNPMLIFEFQPDSQIDELLGVHLVLGELKNWKTKKRIASWLRVDFFIINYSLYSSDFNHISTVKIGHIIKRFAAGGLIKFNSDLAT